MKIIKQIAFFLISIVVIGYALVFFNEKFEFFCANSQGNEYYQIYGVLGDYVCGILGTIIGFITLILVYLTYTSQKDQLKLQSQLIAQQQFESTFFNMLNVHRELKNNLSINGENITGVNVFKIILNKSDELFKANYFRNKNEFIQKDFINHSRNENENREIEKKHMKSLIINIIFFMKNISLY